MTQRLLLIVISLFLLNVSILADYYTDSQGIVYSYDPSGNTAYVADGESATGAVVIPATIQVDGKTYSVTEIGRYAFEGSSGLTSITFSNIAIEIGEDAFNCGHILEINITDLAAWCMDGFGYAFSSGYTLCLNGEKITNLVVPDSATSIGSHVFRNCKGLTSVTIGNSVEGIGDLAFQSCSDLTSVTIGNSVTSIGSAAFSYCTGLTSIDIPNSVKSIGDRVFEGCTGLTSITIPKSVTSIEVGMFGESLFSGCTNLTSIVVDKDNPYYDSRENSNCLIETKSNTILGGCNNSFIPSSIMSIGDGAFSGCTGLTSVTIPNSVTEIGDYAFEDCTGLTSIIIPNSVKSIGTNWGSTFSGCTGLTSVIIGNSVESIGDGAFYGCTGLTSIVIPNSVKSIGTDWNGAFHGCTGLTSVIIGNSVEIIGDYAFEDCTGLTSITIPNSVTSIGGNAFLNCTGLTSVTIGNSVEIIGDDAFEDCTGLTSITIPNSVTSIGGNAFRNCTGLTSVTIGNSVESIGDDAFSYCDNLNDVYIDIVDFANDNICWDIAPNRHYLYKGKEIKGSFTIPNSVTSLGESTFDGCMGLTSVTIPNSVTSIADWAFWECESLTSVTIPKSVKSIGMGVFGWCEKLTSMVVNKNNPMYDSRENCNCIIETATNTLVSGCKNSVIPNSVTSIGYYAFSGCTGLTSITIPNSVTEIGGYAFRGCTGLESVKYMTTKPFDINKYVFSDKTYETATLKIASGCSKKVRIFYGWKNFKNIVEVPAHDLNDDGDVNTADVTAVYSFIKDGEGSGLSEEVADTNGDGDVNTADVVSIYDYIISGSNNDEPTRTLSGIWGGDWGYWYEDWYGYKYYADYTYVMFVPDYDNATSGIGYHKDFYSKNTTGDVNSYYSYLWYKFEWEIKDGVIYISHSEGHKSCDFTIRDYWIDDTIFGGYYDDSSNSFRMSKLTGYYDWVPEVFEEDGWYGYGVNKDYSKQFEGSAKSKSGKEAPAIISIGCNLSKKTK